MNSGVLPLHGEHQPLQELLECAAMLSTLGRAIIEPLNISQSESSSSSSSSGVSSSASSTMASDVNCPSSVGGVTVPDVNQSITHFANDSRTMTGAKAFITDPDPKSFQALDKPSSIQEFQRTAVKVAQFKILTTTTGNFLTLAVPSGLSNGLWNRKMADFRYFRGGFKFTFVLNAQPFASGRLWFYFAPAESFVGTRNSSRTLQNILAYPGVEMDIGTKSQPTLEIPFIAPAQFIDLVLGLGTLGNLHGYVLVPLASGNNAEFAQVSVYAQLVEPKLGIRTLNPNPIFGQGGDEAESATRTGVVSGTFKAVSGIASLWGRLPVVSRAASKVKWFCDLAAKTAESIGFSRPFTLATMTFTERTIGRGICNYDFQDNSHSLGCSVRNEIIQDPTEFSSSMDEMSITYLASRQSVVSSFDWFVSYPSDTQLFTGIMSPAWFQSVTSGVYTPTVLAYLCNAFRLWRGSLIYRISFAKTSFHSGRVEIAIIAGARLPVTTASLESCPRYIVDLSLTSEIEIEVPYNNQYPFKVVEPPSPYDYSDPICSLGLLSIRVVNELAAPDTVSQFITALVTVRGGEDFALAMPLNPLNLVSEGVYDFEQTADHLDQENVGKVFNRAYDIAPTDQNVEARCTGEAIVSVRQLIKMSGRETDWSAFSSGANFVYALDTGWFKDNAVSPFSLPPVNYWSLLYRFYSGGLRYKFKMLNKPKRSGADVPGCVMYAQVVGPISGAIQTTYTAPAGSINDWTNRFSFVNVDLCDVLEIFVPFYHTTALATISNNTVYNGEYRPQIVFKAVWPGQTATDTPPYVIVLKSAGDDFSFGYMVGPPPLAFA